MAQSGIKQSTGLLNLTTNGVKLRACAKQFFYFPTSADFPSYAVEAYLLSMSAVRFCIEFVPLRLWGTNDASFGHLKYKLNPETKSRIIFFLLTFSFYQRKSKGGIYEKTTCSRRKQFNKQSILRR